MTEKRGLSRRDFVKALAGAAAGLVLAGCEPEPSIDPSKQRLITEIDILPPSAIKDLLVARIRPFYAVSPPPPSRYGKVTIPTLNSQVVFLHTQKAGGRGGYNFRNPPYPESAKYQPLKDFVTQIPYPFMVKPTEEPQIPRPNRLPDGTPFVAVTFGKNIPAVTGFSHYIDVTTPNPNIINPKDQELYKALISFTLVKEACSHLVFDLWCQKIIQIMQQYQIPITTNAKLNTGSTAPVETFSQAMVILHQSKGRLVAAVDIASHLVAFQAASQSPYFSFVQDEPVFAQVVPEALAVTLGKNPEDVLQNSLRWAINSPKAALLHHQGDLNQIVELFTPLALV